MLIRPYKESGRVSVSALDVETVVDSVAELRLIAGRLSWTESPLQTARKKHHDLASYLEEDLWSWEGGFVALRHGHVIGFAASGLSAWNRRLSFCGTCTWTAQRAVRGSHRLCSAVLDGERVARAQHVWLETQADNVPAIRAYERMGFRVVGLNQTFYGDRPGADTAVFMSRRIGHEATQ
jgi:ribosomal protein S18 acetylase RimI-like enzyme